MKIVYCNSILNLNNWPLNMSFVQGHWREHYNNVFLRFEVSSYMQNCCMSIAQTSKLKNSSTKKKWFRLYKWLSIMYDSNTKINNWLLK